MYVTFISNADCPNRLSFDGHPSTSEFLLLSNIESASTTDIKSMHTLL